MYCKYSYYCFYCLIFYPILVLLLYTVIVICPGLDFVMRPLLYGFLMDQLLAHYESNSPIILGSVILYFIYSKCSLAVVALLICICDLSLACCVSILMVYMNDLYLLQMNRLFLINCNTAVSIFPFGLYPCNWKLNRNLPLNAF